MEVKYKYRKRVTISFELSQRSKDSPMGRFGGGWNWELGFILGGTSLILSLLVFSIRVTVKRGLA